MVKHTAEGWPSLERRGRMPKNELSRGTPRTSELAKLWYESESKITEAKEQSRYSSSDTIDLLLLQPNCGEEIHFQRVLDGS